MRRMAAVAVAAMLAPAVLAGCGRDKKPGADTTVVAATETTVASAAATKEAEPTETTAVPLPDTGLPLSVDAVENTATSYAFKFSATTIKAGPVTITFRNTGKLQHELILLKTDRPFNVLIVASDNKIDEATSVGEVPETDGGKTVVKTFDLAPGKYDFVCNIPGHYRFGMRTAFTVTA